MKRSPLLFAAITIATLSMASTTSHASLIVTTNDGNGADSYVQLGAAGSNFGTATQIIIKDSNNGGTTRKGYLRFDISASGPVPDSELQLVVSTNNQGGGGTTPQTHTVQVFGLTNETLDNWIESGPGSITFTNAPANQIGDNFNGDAQLLGSFIVPNSPVGTLLTFSSPALTGFINADTNGLATILLRREGGNGGHNLGFASKEHGSLAAPTLVLIPEPASASVLLGLGLSSLLATARRRRSLPSA